MNDNQKKEIQIIIDKYFQNSQKLLNEFAYKVFEFADYDDDDDDD